MGWGNKASDVWNWGKGGSQYTPILGFYDSSDPDVVDWHIKWLVERGVNILLLPSTLRAPWELAKENGLFRAKFLPYVKFAMVQMAYLGKDFTTIQAAKDTMSYYCNNYFDHPQYFKIGRKPFVMLWRMQNYCMGYSVENFTSFVKVVRDTARSYGYELYLVGDVMGYYPQQYQELIAKQFDAISAYAIIDAGAEWTQDAKGQPYLVAPYDSMVSGYIEQASYWFGLSKNLSINFIPPLISGFSDEKMYTLGYDNWLCERTDYSPDKFKTMIEGIKPYIDPEFNMVIVHAFNENQEGSMMEPSKEYGFGNLDTLYGEFQKP